MIETTVKFVKKPKLKRPVLIEGLPGLGLVGKIAVDHMIKELNAKKFADLYSPHFPPQVVIRNDGLVDMMKDEFYYWKGKGKDIIFIAGDHQANNPFAHYEVADVILDVAKKYKVKTVYTLGGYGVGYLSKKPKVFAAVTNPKLIPKLKKAGATFDKTGAIVGAAGLLVGLGSLKGMDGVCLMGETHGQIIDARAAKAVLEVLGNLVGVRVDTSELETRAKEIEKIVERSVKKVETPEPTPEAPHYIR